MLRAFIFDAKIINYLSHSIKDIKQLGIDKHEEYRNATPFPNIVINNFCDEDMLSKVAEEFPGLSKLHDVKAYDTQNEKYKLGAKGESILAKQAACWHII